MENLTTKANILNDSIFNVIDGGKELEFKKLILEFQTLSEELSLTELVDLVLEKTGIRKELEMEDTIESQSRLENLEEFKSITKSFEDKYGNYLSQEQLAREYFVSTGTITSWIKKGKIFLKSILVQAIQAFV